MTGKRRGVGSLISVMFMLLILVSGFGYYQTRLTMQTRRQSILDEADEYNSEKTLEDLEINDIALSGSNQLKLKVKNTGEILLKISYIGVFNEFGSPSLENYSDIDFSVTPLDEAWYNSSIIINPSNEYDIQLLTQRGNSFYTEYATSGTGGGGSGNGTNTQITISEGGILDQNFPTSYQVISGTYSSGSVPGSLTTVDGNDLVVTSQHQTTDLTYTPDSYNITLGVLDSGTISDVQQDDLNQLSITSNSSEFPAPWSQWSYRKRLSVNSSYVDQNLVNFPVLINITDPELAAHAQNDFDDVAFVAMDNVTQLDHEIETYDNVTGLFSAWISVNLSSSQDTDFWMYYGNPSSLSQENPVQVWDSDYVLVHHMEEIVAGHGGTLLDSTAYNQDGLTRNGVTTDVNGVNDGGVSLDGVDDTIRVDDSAVLDITDQITLEAWINLNNVPDNTDMRILEKERSYEFKVKWKHNKWEYKGKVKGVSGNDEAKDTDAPFSTLTWTYVAFTYNGSDLNLYLQDAVIANETGRGSIDTKHKALFIGSKKIKDKFFDGMMDEVRISNTGRSNAWIKASYYTVSEPDNFIALGPQESTDKSISVVFTGDSNTLTLNAINWTVHLSYDSGSVPTTLQLYNYTSEEYPETGDGYISYTSIPTPNTEEISSQHISSKPEDFRNTTGEWMIKVTGALPSGNSSGLIDYISYETETDPIYNASVTYNFTGINSDTPLSVTIKLVSDQSLSNSNSIVQLYDFSAQQYVVAGEAYHSWLNSGPDEVVWLNITSNPEYYVNGGVVILRFTSLNPFQVDQNTNQLYINYTYASSQLPNDVFKEYLVEVSEVSSGQPLPYINLILYASGSNIEFHGESNPHTTSTDVDGEYLLRLKSSTLGGETFNLYAYVGSLAKSKELTQQP